LVNTITIVAGILRLWITSADLGAIPWEAFEAAFFEALIRLVSALGSTITDFRFGNTITISTLPLTLRATTTFGVIFLESFETTFSIGSITLIRAMSYTITVILLSDTITIFTGPLSCWVTSALFRRVGLETTEATLLVTFISTGSHLGDRSHQFVFTWSTSTHLVGPGLEATVLFHGFSGMSLVKFAGVSNVVLSISTHKTLFLAVLLAV